MAEAGGTAVGTRSAGGVAPAALDLLPRAFNRDDSAALERPATPPSRWRDGLLRSREWVRSCIAEEAEFGHLLYWAPVFMGAGAILWFSAARTPSTIYLCGLLLVLGTVAMGWRYRKPVTAAICAALALICVGAISAAWETARAGTTILDTPVTVTVTGVVTTREAVAGSRWRYSVEIIDTVKPRLKRVPGSVTLTAPGRPVALGATVRGRARLLPPSGPALAGLNDFAFDAYFAGSGAIGYFLGRPEEVDATVAQTGSVYRSTRLALEDLRGAISARIREVLPGDTGAFAASMVTDDRRAISKETTEALRLAGLTHVVAISGLNMALAAGLFFVGIRMVLSLSQDIAHRYPIKKIAAFGALISVTGYYLISGFAVSAERAYIIMAIMLVAAVFGRPSISLRNVAFSALAILLISPSAIMGPGFQMSFAATLALVAGYSLWQRQGHPAREPGASGFFTPLSLAWAFAAGVFATSLIGVLSTALFSIEHFHRLAVWGLPANLLAMPVISLVVMPTGLAALVLMPIGLDWLPLKLMGIGLDIVIAIAKWTASLDGEVVTGRMHGWLFAGMTLCLVVVGIMRSRLRFAGVAVGASLLVVNWAIPGVPRPDLVIHEEGRLAGLVTGERLASTAVRPSAFVFEQWQRALPVGRHVKPIMEETPPRARGPLSDEQRRHEITTFAADMAAPPTGRFRCREGRWCVARAWNGSRIVVMDIRELVGAACDCADLVVTPAAIKWRKCHSGATLLSATQLRRSGSVEIWLDPENIREFRVISGLGQSDRPWYVHRTYDWRSGTYAQVEGQNND